jgi:calcium and integrin-binding protein 1
VVYRTSTRRPQQPLDFDNDGYIGRADLIDTLTALCGDGELSKAEVDEVATKILVEADLDGDERLSYVEFDNVVARAPDFVNSFRVRI